MNKLQVVQIGIAILDGGDQMPIKGVIFDSGYVLSIGSIGGVNIHKTPLGNDAPIAGHLFKDISAAYEWIESQPADISLEELAKKLNELEY